MYAVTVEFGIDPSRAVSFIAHVRTNATQSIGLEPGCHRFDVCHDPASPGTVFLYELYDDEAAFRAHLETEHFRDFDGKTAAMVRSKTVRTYREVWT